MTKPHTTNHEQSLDKAKFGFWVYVMTDCVLFATLFATYAVLRNNTAEGPSAKDLFSLNFVLLETMLLLTSSFTYGLALIFAKQNNKKMTINWLTITAMLGLSFLAMELYEFNHLITEGHAWSASAFLSAYFTLVGTHGLHIIIGLIWIFVSIFRLKQGTLNIKNNNSLTMLGIFWHFLDIIWIFIFSFVYLIGVAL
ncbi:cytochrome o ubiquinol oxidase subunit III [Candidatus Saccharibacteria bacterium]|nr:cytochrome o ubiquinol oxidase subunit III [Candidatus Saccharibacteria bacterium]